MNFHDSPFEREFNTGFFQIELVVLEGKKMPVIGWSLFCAIERREIAGAKSIPAQIMHAAPTNAAIALVN